MGKKSFRAIVFGHYFVSFVGKFLKSKVLVHKRCSLF